MKTWIRLLVSGAVLFTVGCGDPDGSPALTDAAARDSGSVPDAASDSDATAPTDCGGEVRVQLTITGAEDGEACIDPICERWLTIGRAGGGGVPLDLDCTGVACMGCQQLACSGAACGYTPLNADTLEGTWGGFEVVASTCDSMACQGFACAAPGQYVAQMCVGRRAPAATECGFGTALERICTEVEFTWPMTGDLTGTIDFGG